MILVIVYGLDVLGGWGELCCIVGFEMFNFWKLLVFEGVEGIWVFVFIEDWMAWYFNSNYFWVGMLFCVFIIGLWYWCMD